MQAVSGERDYLTTNPQIQDWSLLWSESGGLRLQRARSGVGSIQGFHAAPRLPEVAEELFGRSERLRARVPAF